MTDVGVRTNGPGGGMNGPGARMNGPGAMMTGPGGGMNGPGGGMNGPGGGMNGPGGGMNGPGGGMNGPGARMNGPGAMNGPGGGMNGPGARMNGPGAMMNGPGGMNGPGPGMMFNGPGPGAVGAPGAPGPSMMSGPGVIGGGGMGMMGLKPIENVPDAPEITGDLTCVRCQEPIVGPIVQAMGKNYHPDHFVCEYCSQPFPGGRFIKASDDNLYCEQDFAELFAKRCKVCNDIIRGKVVNADGVTFHPEHFICVGCGTNMVGQAYKVHPDTKHVYCKTCLPPELRKIRPEDHICAQCSQAIVGPYLLIKGQFMHPRHFRCHECGAEFKGGDCHEFEGDYYCAPHYEILLLKKCARCGKPCKGRSITALGKVWHPDHFTCHICSVPFAESHYYENDGLPYCETHYVQLFGNNCAHCKEPILKNTVKFLDKAYHAEHFLCNTCQKPLKSGSFTAWDSKPICKVCYGKLPAKLRKEVETRMKEEKKSKMRREKEEKALAKNNK
eukprot:TRINITY_DN150_c0_g1_i6.p1 TRINITY_DN150_c0_g1~~TRINITY_DN150_c0_g1_i6.p1  ORF type:complete len:500 (-),score=50.28 TRINITY_DN150_c0_g1_i6:41-1540(-)